MLDKSSEDIKIDVDPSTDEHDTVLRRTEENPEL